MDATADDGRPTVAAVSLRLGEPAWPAPRCEGGRVAWKVAQFGVDPAGAARQTAWDSRLRRDPGHRCMIPREEFPYQVLKAMAVPTTGHHELLVSWTYVESILSTALRTRTGILLTGSLEPDSADCAGLHPVLHSMGTGPAGRDRRSPIAGISAKCLTGVGHERHERQGSLLVRSHVT